MGDGAAEDEAARFDAGHFVDLGASHRLHQLIDSAAKGSRIAEQSGDIAKLNTRLWIVRNGANGLFQIV